MATLVHEVAPQYMTVAEVADLLRVSPATIRRHADQLGAQRIGRTLRFPMPVQAPTLEVPDGRDRPDRGH
jgi:excisionase family DNA binding protein